MLGKREPEIYGEKDYNALLTFIDKVCKENSIEYKHFQSNHEGKIVDEIQNAYGVYDGIVINPAAYTHTSIAILDALKAVNIRAVEVHLSDTSIREDFRKISYPAMYCEKTYKGFGFDGYKMAIEFFSDK